MKIQGRNGLLLNSDFDRIEHLLGVRFKNRRLLQRAFTHKSFALIRPQWAGGDNERLELLGDAVLNLVIIDHLLKLHGSNEGDTSRARAALLKNSHYSKIAARLNLGQYLCCAPGTSVADKSKCLADLLEAVAGALFLDQGYEGVLSLVPLLFPRAVENVAPEMARVSDIDELQRTVHERRLGRLFFRRGRKHIADGKRIYRIEVYLNDLFLAFGEGERRNLAKDVAVTKALKELYTRPLCVST